MSRPSSGDGADRRSAHKQSGSKAAGSGRTRRSRRSPGGKPSAARRRREDASSPPTAADDEQYAQFMQSYGTGAEMDMVSPKRTARPNNTTAQRRRRIADVRQVSLGLIIQGISLTAAIILLGLILTLWTFGYLESGAVPLAWITIALGGAGALTGEVLCLAVPEESKTRHLARTGFVLTCLMLAGLTVDALMSNQGPVFRIVLDVINLLLIMSRMCLVTFFLSRLAGYVEEPTYETRSVFAMVGMPLAMAATFGYLKFVPATTDESALSFRAVTSGLQWWIIATTVAVAVMYISILLGMGLALRKHRTESA